MSSDDTRRAFPPNIEWSNQHDGILEELIYGDYMANGPPKTRHDVDPSLNKPYLTEELFCSMADGRTTYDLIESYKSTDVAATAARRTRDTAQLERLEAQSAGQATYLGKQNASQAALRTRQETYLAKQQARQEEQQARQEEKQARQEELHAQNRRNLAAATVYTDGGWGKSSGGKRREASSTLGGQQFGPELPRISELTKTENSGAVWTLERRPIWAACTTMTSAVKSGSLVKQKLLEALPHRRPR